MEAATAGQTRLPGDGEGRASRVGKKLSCGTVDRVSWRSARRSICLPLLAVAGAMCAALPTGAQQGVTQPVLTPAPAAPPPPPIAAAATGDVSGSYVIGSDDSLQITVWKEPNLSGALLVRPDGMITLPLVGDVVASGLTPTALGTDLATRLKKFISDPLVTVTVIAVNSKRVYLLGEVARVGPLALSPGLTPLQAIAEAGGLSPYAHAKDIYILRMVNGKQQKIAFNYKKALKTGDQQSVSLLPGDTIVVP